MLNPALAGFLICPEISLHSRTESIANVTGNMMLSSAYDQYVEKLQGGIGIHILKDNYANGTLSQTYADLMYSYHIKYKPRTKLALALQTTFYQRKINDENLILRSMILPFSNNSSTNTFITSPPLQDVRFAGGVAFASKKNHFGLSFHNLSTQRFNNNQENLVKITTYFAKKISFHNFGASKGKYNLLVSVLLRQQGIYQQALYGINFGSNRFTLGVKLKHSFVFNANGFVFNAGFSIKNLSFLYSYDTMFTRNFAQLYNAQQISVYYRLKCTKQNKKRNTIFCPQ